ncbi:hypothetical protein PoB_000364500 [Plakobranchus ocellatus]|uniref:SRCR domain-containing protein n=1 Tax=Plakobranchus ocellatus TaxID=259542 RepID=A0AAV3Y3A9_9GAST|nr:hypothetical protein PoB_000364500 [Plakobranchus ocellatus]
MTNVSPCLGEFGGLSSGGSRLLAWRALVTQWLAYLPSDPSVVSSNRPRMPCPNRINGVVLVVVGEKGKGVCRAPGQESQRVICETDEETIQPTGLCRAQGLTESNLRDR